MKLYKFCNTLKLERTLFCYMENYLKIQKQSKSQRGNSLQIHYLSIKLSDLTFSVLESGRREMLNLAEEGVDLFNID